MVDKDLCISLFGKATASQAAKILGCSRNRVAVIWNKRQGLCGCGRPLDGHGRTCERCLVRKRAESQRYYAKNTEKMKTYNKNNRRKFLYGISSEEYERMLKKQDGVCAICKQPETKLSRHGATESLAVDHDHETGEIRGLLCHKCNVVLGHVNDSVQILGDMIQYLNKTVTIA